MVRKKGYIPKHCRHKHKNLGYVCLNGRTLYTGGRTVEEDPSHDVDCYDPHTHDAGIHDR